MQTSDTRRIESEALTRYKPIAVKALRAMRIGGPGYEDARQIADLAIVEAVRSYDPSKKAAISTWVHSMIGWRVRDWLDKETRLSRVVASGAPGDLDRLMFPGCES